MTSGRTNWVLEGGTKGVDEAGTNDTFEEGLKEEFTKSEDAGWGLDTEEETNVDDAGTILRVEGKLEEEEENHEDDKEGWVVVEEELEDGDIAAFRPETTFEP